ncbi:MAG: Histidine--tRNA ligase [Bacteroidetes bacterium ADurb.Bin408]|nr:MAG: Histidine--tRNA ligase [Bacteroidetes bacterium ADurb.Bin408]
MALRAAGVPSEIYPDEAKMKKQMAYADKLNIPYVVIAGTEEMKNNSFTLKNMKTGQQNACAQDDIIRAVLP